MRKYLTVDRFSKCDPRPTARFAGQGARTGAFRDRHIAIGITYDCRLVGVLLAHPVGDFVVLRLTT